MLGCKYVLMTLDLLIGQQLYSHWASWWTKDEHLRMLCLKYIELTSHEWKFLSFNYIAIYNYSE